MADYKRQYGAGAVYGSLAYDFNNPALQPEYAEEAKWNVQHQLRDEVVEQEQTVAKAAAKNMQSIAPLSVLGVAVAAVMVIIMLLAQARLTAVCNEAVTLSEKIQQLETEQSRLRIAFESAFNLTEVEDYAIHELGMQKPGGDQIFCINTASHDRIEVFQPEGSQGMLDRFGDLIGSVQEYLG